MYKRYFRKKDPACRPEDIEWIEMSGKEFYRFINSPEGKTRYGVLSAILAEPDIIQTPPPCDSHVQEKVSQLENELFDALNAAEFDEPAAKAKAVALASARFESVGSTDYETIRIQYILRKTEPCGDLDTELLRQIISAVLIHPHGAVSLKLKNGQILQRRNHT